MLKNSCPWKKFIDIENKVTMARDGWGGGEKCKLPVINKPESRMRSVGNTVNNP